MTYVKYLIITILLISVSIIVFRIFVRRDYQLKGKLSPFSSVLQFILFFLHAISSYSYIDSASYIGEDSPLYFIAVGLMVIGVVLLLLAMGWLGFGDAIGLKVSGLKQSGLYRYTRNPQVVTGFLFYIGYALVMASWGSLIWLIVLLVMLHIMIITEEEHLRRTFGEEYKSYCEKTPRYIGFKSFR